MMAKKHAHLVPADDPDQMLMPDVRPITLRDRLQWQMEQPLASQREQKPLDTGFWDPMRQQMDLF